MAVDEAISIAVREGLSPTTLRFYTWDPPCLSIGYFQTPGEYLKCHHPEHASVSNCSDRHIVRRITGGRAVYHGNDLSYSVVSRTDNSLFPNKISGAYNVISRAVVAGLRLMEIYPDPIFETTIKKYESGHYRKSILCFNTTFGHEITVDGKKLVGSAQRRWREVFLQHGSILISREESENGHASVALDELKKWQEAFYDIDYIASTISRGFQEVLDIEFKKESLSDYETDLTEKLIKEKYSRL